MEYKHTYFSFEYTLENYWTSTRGAVELKMQ